ncbi:hypothetical protein [Sphingobacterium faecium]|uniref:hypothetical protein n=1 Tax=Sphingobacterium faecium TaxID=34087 RepID=UPI003209FD17
MTCRICIFIFLFFFWKDSFAQIELSYSLNPKITTNSLAWNIAGNSIGENPNVLSELIWKRITSIGTDLKVGMILKQKYTLDIGYSFNKTINGVVTDIDYDKDNRLGIVSKEQYNSDRGNRYLYNLKFGYLFHKNWGELIFFSMAEFSKNNYTLVNTSDGLFSKYSFDLIGGGVGLLTSIDLGDYLQLKITNSYLINQYNATADWNLRKDFSHPISFVHNTSISKLDNHSLLNYRISNHLKIGFFIELSKYFSNGWGVDKLYYSNKEVSFTRLNDVSFKIKTVGFSVTIQDI